MLHPMLLHGVLADVLVRVGLGSRFLLGVLQQVADLGDGQFDGELHPGALAVPLDMDVATGLLCVHERGRRLLAGSARRLRGDRRRRGDAVVGDLFAGHGPAFSLTAPSRGLPGIAPGKDRYADAMRRIAVMPLLVVLALTGCSSSEAPAPQRTSAPASAGIETISDVFAELDCSGMKTDGEAPVVKEGQCRVDSGNDLAFFWEFETAESARAWLESGDLEVGAADAVYVAGPVVLMARDAGTAQRFAEFATPYP